MYALRQTVPPTQEPVSLEQAKLQCRVSISEDDTLILGYISAAREHLETVTRKQFLTATWVMGLEDFPCGWSSRYVGSYRHGGWQSYIELPRSPLQQVLTPDPLPAVTYTDSNGDAQTLSSDVYGIDTLHEPGRLYLKSGQSWPSTYNVPNAVQVTFKAGWTTPDRVPATLRQVILLLVASMYENREATAEKALSMIPGVEAMIWGNRLVEVV